MFRTCTITTLAALSLCASQLSADVEVQEFTDAQAWQEAVGSYSTIDFTNGEHFELIGGDFADSHGVTFGDSARYWNSPSFPNDFWGFRAVGGAWLEFDEPQMWIGADHPGILAFELYFEDELIYVSPGNMGGSGTGFFSGLLSSHPFDQVYLHRQWPDNLVFVDDLHFGTIAPAPGALGAFALAALCARSRRRTRE